MASSPDCIVFPSRDAMAARLGDLLQASLTHGGTLALSGGSTPKALYEDLAARDLDWAKVRISLVDERWVPPDHPRSNEAFVRKAFASAKDASIHGLYNGAPTPQDAVGAVAADLDARGGQPFDVVVLGMGDDGHAASWFPYAEGLEVALVSEDKLCAVTARRSDVTGEEVDRMTLTLSAIREARLIVLLLAGESKRATFERALTPGPVEAMPVRAILRARPDLWVCWAP